MPWGPPGTIKINMGRYRVGGKRCRVGQKYRVGDPFTAGRHPPRLKTPPHSHRWGLGGGRGFYHTSQILPRPSRFWRPNAEMGLVAVGCFLTFPIQNNFAENSPRHRNPLGRKTHRIDVGGYMRRGGLEPGNRQEATKTPFLGRCSKFYSSWLPSLPNPPEREGFGGLTALVTRAQLHAGCVESGRGSSWDQIVRRRPLARWTRPPEEGRGRPASPLS
jgi:hypothetical protein